MNLEAAVFFCFCFFGQAARTCHDWTAYLSFIRQESNCDFKIIFKKTNKKKKHHRETI